MLEVKKLAQAIMLATLSFSGVGYAQDFVPAEEPAAVIEQKENSVSSDAGVQAIAEVAEQPYIQEEPAEFVSAEDQLTDYLGSKNWTEGWDKDKKRMFVVYSESFNVEDPSYDTDFISKRSLKATMASMGAKAKVVEFMRTQMSATDQLSAPGTDVHEQLNKKYNMLTKKISKQQVQLVKLMAQVDAAEAKQLEGVTWNDLGKEALIAAIKKLDDSFDAGEIDEENRKSYEKAKARFKEASTSMAALEEQAQAISGDIKLESSSSIETLAKAPLLGATLLAQAESWNEKEEEYQVAVVLVWSPKLEKAAESILTGSPIKTKPKANGKSIGDWVRTQDLSTMVGSRQFVDKDGERWFIGAYGSLLDGSASAKRAAKGQADLFARKEAAVSLFADLETHKQAETVMQTRNAGLGGNDATAVAESFAETTRQSIENRQISGMSKLLSKSVRHPVSGQKLYVVLYGISANIAADALKAEASSYKKAISAAKSNTFQQGVKQSYDQTLETAKKDKTALTQGQQAGKAALVPEKPAVKMNSSTKKVVKSSNSNSSSSNSSGGPTKSQTVFAAPEVDDDDF